jgi:4-amino-4-deoxy-L-arabinose transferase-like glycosyltransferase
VRNGYAFPLSVQLQFRATPFDSYIFLPFVNDALKEGTAPNQTPMKRKGIAIPHNRRPSRSELNFANAHKAYRTFLSSLLLIFLIALSVRALTAYFIYTHLSDPSWFQSGTYQIFDRKAQFILERKSSLFWIDDATQTESAVYPPGYPLWIASIYALTGHRSPASVQQFQWVLDAFSVLLIVGIGSASYNRRVGLVAGFLVALSPLLALSGAVPLADAPTSWLVLGGVWLLIVATKHQRLWPALGAGLLVGLSCWFRANGLLLPIFWLAALLFWKTAWRNRIQVSSAVMVGMIVVVTPLLIRNAVAFHVLTPTGLGAGTNLWEGIGETDRAAEFGAVYGDQNVVEQERKKFGASPTDTSFSLYYPNGVERDRARAQKAFTVIRAHPLWYAGVMLRRMVGVLKFAGNPQPFYGSSGINVTSSKCLPPSWQGGVLSAVVAFIGMVQSVLRYLALPLMVVGIGVALRLDWRMTLLVLSTILYYWIVGSALHTEIRYGLPMQALLFVFAAMTLSAAVELLRSLRASSPDKVQQ